MEMLIIFLISSRAAHTLPDLPYDYNALEPVIMTMMPSKVIIPLLR